MRYKRKKPKKQSKVEKALARRQARILRAKRLKRKFAKLQKLYQDRIVKSGINKDISWTFFIEGATKPHGSQERFNAFCAVNDVQKMLGVDKDTLWTIARAIHRGRIK